MEKAALFQIYEPHRPIDFIERTYQSLDVDEHGIAGVDHPLERLWEDLAADADGHSEIEPRVGQIRGANRVAGGDSPQDSVLVAVAAVGVRVEMRVEQSGSRIRHHDRVAIGVVGEVMADFGNQTVSEGEAVENGGDEGGGAAESLGHDDVVSDEDVVAVVASD